MPIRPNRYVTTRVKASADAVPYPRTGFLRMGVREQKRTLGPGYKTIASDAIAASRARNGGAA